MRDAHRHACLARIQHMRRRYAALLAYALDLLGLYLGCCSSSSRGEHTHLKGLELQLR